MKSDKESREALNELLQKLRVAQDEILEQTNGDFRSRLEDALNTRGAGDPRLKEYREALEFLKFAATLGADDIVDGFQKFLPLLAQMIQFYPESDDKCSRLDYLMYVGSALGGVPEDKYIEKQAGDDASLPKEAAECVALTGRLIEACRQAADPDVKAVVCRGLLGAVSFLEMEKTGAQPAPQAAFGKEADEAEMYALAQKYALNPAVISRAIELSEQQLAETQSRRRRKKEGRG